MVGIDIPEGYLSWAKRKAAGRRNLSLIFEVDDNPSFQVETAPSDWSLFRSEVGCLTIT